MIDQLQQAFAEYWQDSIDSRYAKDDAIGAVIAYAAAGAGKRVRPLLCLLTADACNGDWRSLLPAAAALEMVHTYSLVHDDLPCMDDDDLRRGRATAHIKFSQELALLAGDALLTDAFALITQSPLPAATQVAMVRVLAEAAGGRGMVRGQALDLFWTKRQGANQGDLDEIHSLKTGYLLGAACALGAIGAHASPEVCESLESFGRYLGLAFQIQDDLLDNSAGTGKSLGKDAEAGKLTYLSLMSKSAAFDEAKALTEKAVALVDQHVSNPHNLIDFSQSLLKRKS